MKFQFAPTLIALACVGVTACHFPSFGAKAKAPVGEVVATVDGQEITVRDLQAELAGANFADPAQRKQADRAALQRIVGRTILAKAARAEGIDKTPDFALQKQRTIDNLLAQTLEAKAASSVPPPTREEAQSFITSHPDIFAERKIFDLDQIRVGRPTDPKMLEQLRPLNTLEDIAALLTRDQIKFQRGTTALDAVGADPKMVEAVVKLPPHEVFVVPNGNLILISQIKDTRIAPFTGETAVTYALNVLKQQHAREAVERKVGAIMNKGAATVRFNKAYQPAPAPGNPATAPAGSGKAS